MINGLHAVINGGLSAEAINRDRFGMPRTPDMGLNKIMVGQGAGNDPIEEDKPSGGGVPSGVIAVWHGTLATIPAGWVLCDGNNSTPNLLDRFIESVPDAVTDPGATGGADAKTTSGYTHDLPISYWSADNSFRWDRNAATGAEHEANRKVTSESSFGHDEPMFSSYSKTDSITDIRPKYYDVAFIMKT